MTETELQKQITEFLELHGYIVYRMQASKLKYNCTACPPGTPDLLAVGYRLTLWIEVKLPGKELSPEQGKHITELRNRNQRILIAHTIYEVQEYLKHD